VAPLSVPQLETEQVTVQFTPFAPVSLVSAAVNACVLPSSTVKVAGETATVIDGLLPPPQPENSIPNTNVKARPSFFIKFSPSASETQSW
jgi:hypothetical protein